MNVAEIIGYQYVQNLALEQRVKALTAANAECGRLLAKYRELHGELPLEPATKVIGPDGAGNANGANEAASDLVGFEERQAAERGKAAHSPTEEGHADGPRLVRPGTEEPNVAGPIRPDCRGVATAASPAEF